MAYLYLSVKALHIIFVVAWMAGLLIFPRYKLHQMSSSPGEPLFETLKEASTRLKKVILTPAMLLVWVLGFALVAINPGVAAGGWFIIKLALVIAMTGVHGYFSSFGRKIDEGLQPVTPGRLRLLNELPFVIMIIIVFLVVLKPFSG